MTVARETKSWTWVNDRACVECGFDASATDHREVTALLPATAESWSGVLARHAVDRLVARPNTSTWSPLEYACHVRDVLALLAYRFDRTLAEERPTFEPWHPNDLADERRYDEERDPAAVAAAIVANARRCAEVAGSMTEDGWGRRGTRADGVEFSNAWLATYLTHDVVHHLHDVERILAIG